MKILVTNDDGIFRRGLWALAAELQKVAEVVVVAPDREQSAVSASITLRYPLHYTEVTPLVEGIKAYSVTGTPSDSVILALGMLEDIGIVFSGVNEGSNLGSDVLLSGTVGAALHGYFHGLPSIALSMAEGEEMHFEVAARLASSLASQLINSFASKEMLLNINLPNLPLDEIKGIELTRLASKDYSGFTAEEYGKKKKHYRIVRKELQWNGGEGTDAWAVDEGRISITPLQGEMGIAPENGAISDLRTSLLRMLSSF